MDARVKIIASKRENDPLNELTRNRFMVPREMSFLQFMIVLRKKLTLSPSHALFVFTSKNRLISSSETVAAIHDRDAEDGILYVTYASENAFGGLLGPENNNSLR